MATAAKKTYIKDINQDNVTDWQRTMFSGLSPDVLEKAKVEFTTDKYGNLKKPTGVKTVTKTVGLTGSDSEDTKLVTSYQKDLGTVNGLHLVATYDDKGSLTGFDEWRKSDSAAPVSRVYASDKQYYYPKWDATGKAVQAKGYETKGGGLFSDFFSDVTSGFDDLVLQNPALRAAALSYAMPVLASEVGAATGTSAATGANITKAGIALASGAAPEDLAKSYLVNQATGALGSAVTPSTPAPSSSGMLSSGADYSTGANYDLTTGQDTGGLGLKGSVGAFDVTNPYSFNTTNTGGEGLTLGDKGYNLTNNITGNPLGEDLSKVTTGAEEYLKDTSVDGSKSEATKVAEKLIGKAIMATTTGTGAGTGTDYTALVSGLLGGVGNLAQGSTNVSAREKLAQSIVDAGTSAANMATFKPIGTTTRFGTSSYTTDPKTGAITASYTPSELAQGYQTSLAGMTSAGLLQGQQLQGLANQYLGESPEAVRQRYIDQQTALLAPGQEQKLAEVRNSLFNTGRQGLAFGATSAGGLAATNPEMAAYYNSIANQNRQIAAGADQAAQQQIQFGQGLANAAYSPFNAGFTAQGNVETAAQQPLTLSSNLAKIQAESGANVGKITQEANTAAAKTLFNNNSYNPTAQLLSGAANNPALSKLISSAITSKELPQLVKALQDSGYFTSGEGGLDVSNIDYDYLSTIYKDGNPFEGTTWDGE